MIQRMPLLLKGCIEQMPWRYCVMTILRNHSKFKCTRNVFDTHLYIL